MQEQVVPWLAPRVMAVGPSPGSPTGGGAVLERSSLPAEGRPAAEPLPHTWTTRRVLVVLAYKCTLRRRAACWHQRVTNGTSITASKECEIVHDARAGRAGATPHHSLKTPGSLGPDNDAASARERQNCTPQAWQAGSAICPIRPKLHDVQAERARRRLPGPATPGEVPGAHVVAVRARPATVS